ncbi:hypothetical protein SeMB42_g05783 [Synchytrium endobioticum]|uniref:STIL N-terminal domain-containing protein n=2 Tax=Synchytrium endobioticum TaxID=286115 RepID=A0A507CPE2_9FUNG|nr:hypothetical protein SeMB42_g05783 [Synchytrium endobioticum]
MGRQLQPCNAGIIVDRYDPGRVDGGPTVVIKGDVVIRVVSGDAGRVYSELLVELKAWISSTVEQEANAGMPCCVVCTIKGDNLWLEYKQICADISMRYIPIAPLRLVPGTLTAQVTHRQNTAQPFQMGYITIDHARMVLPITASDPMRRQLPLVGIWVKNVHGVKDNRIYMACVKYLLSTSHQRMNVSVLLVAVFPSDGPAGEGHGMVTFHECHYDIKDERACLFAGHACISFDVDHTVACHMDVVDVPPGQDATWRSAVEDCYNITIDVAQPEVKVQQDTAQAQEEAEVQVQNDGPVFTTESPPSVPVPETVPAEPPSNESAIPPHIPENVNFLLLQQQQQMYLAFLQHQIDTLRSQFATVSTSAAPSHIPNSTPLLFSPLAFLPFLSGGSSIIPQIPSSLFPPPSSSKTVADTPLPLSVSVPQTVTRGTTPIPLFNEVFSRADSETQTPNESVEETVKRSIAVNTSFVDAATTPSEPVVAIMGKVLADAATNTLVMIEDRKVTPEKSMPSLSILRHQYEEYELPTDTGTNYQPLYKYSAVVDPTIENTGASGDVEKVDISSLAEMEHAIPTADNKVAGAEQSSNAMGPSGLEGVSDISEVCGEPRTMDGGDSNDAGGSDHPSHDDGSGTGHANDDDTPSEGKDIIARLARNPESSFMFVASKSDDDDYNTGGDEVLSMIASSKSVLQGKDNTGGVEGNTSCEPYSLATFEYMKKYGLV